MRVRWVSGGKRGGIGRLGLGGCTLYGVGKKQDGREGREGGGGGEGRGG